MTFFASLSQWWSVSRESLDDLARAVTLELEVVASYDRVIQHVGHPGTADQLAQFRNEHAKHLSELMTWRRLARRLPRRTRQEGTGAPSKGFAGLLGFSDDTEGALREMRAVEELAQRGWAALSGFLPSRIGKLIERIREDEKRHLRFLDRLIQSRVWNLEEHVPD